MNRRQLQFAGGGGGGNNIPIRGTTIVVQGSDNPAQAARHVEARIQSNNRKLVETIDKRLKDTYERGLR